MKLRISDDFDLHKIAQSGQCFRVRECEDGGFRFITEKEVLYIRKEASQTFEISCTEDVWNRVWRPYFDLDRSYCRVREAIPDSDTYMRRAANEGCGIRILRQNPWEMLITFIISQRKSIPAIKKSVELLSYRFGEPIATPYETVYAFPAAWQLKKADDEALSECKLGYRIPYIKDAIDSVLSGRIDLTAISGLSDFELLEKLKSVRGVGEKVASCICLFSYGRMTVAPVDTWIQKMIAKDYGGKNPFPAYGDCAGIMQQYAFYYAISNKERFSD